MVIITQPYCNVQRMMLSSFKVHGIYATNVNSDAPVLHAATPFTPGVFWFSVLMLDHHLHLFLLWPASSSQGSPFAFRDFKNKKCNKVVGRVHEAPPFMRCWQESGNAPGGPGGDEHVKAGACHRTSEREAKVKWHGMSNDTLRKPLTSWRYGMQDVKRVTGGMSPLTHTVSFTWRKRLRLNRPRTNIFSMSTDIQIKPSKQD